MKVTIKSKPIREPGVYVVASDAPVSHQNNSDYLCDGVDDQVQIQAAITEVTTKGGVVLLSQGTFNLTDEITVPPKVTVKGSGRNATILTQATSNKKIFDCGSSDGISLTDMYLYVPSTDAGDTIQAGGTGAIIERLTLRGGTTTSYHIHLSNAFNFTIRDIKNYGTQGNGILIDNTDNLYHYGNGVVSNIQLVPRPGAVGIYLKEYDGGKSVNLIDFSGINIVSGDGSGSTGIKIEGVNTCAWSMVDLETVDTKIDMIDASWHTFITVLSLSSTPQVDISLDEDSYQNTFIGTKLANSYQNVVDNGSGNVFYGGNYTPG